MLNIAAHNIPQQKTMPSFQEKKEFASYVVDLMQSIGPVNAKAMFGGYGIFLEGLMFGLIAENVLYLKADAKTENEFKARGLENFTYNKKGKEFKMSYYQAPAEAMGNSEEMYFWAAKAYSAAQRAATKKRKKKTLINYPFLDSYHSPNMFRSHPIIRSSA